MNWRMTGVLFILLLAAGGYFYWQNQQEETAVSTPEPVEIPPTPVRASLIQTTANNVQGVNIIDLNDGTEVLFVQTSPGEWLQTVPAESGVISATLNTAVAGILNLTSIRTLSAEEDLTPYSLNSPTHQINIAINQPEANQTVRVTLYIGSTTPVGTGYYTQRQGDPRIHILPIGIIGNLLNLLNDPPLS